jgi:hypothetical protein
VWFGVQQSNRAQSLPSRANVFLSDGISCLRFEEDETRQIRESSGEKFHAQASKQAEEEVSFHSSNNAILRKLDISLSPAVIIIAIVCFSVQSTPPLFYINLLLSPSLPPPPPHTPST